MDQLSEVRLREFNSNDDSRLVEIANNPNIAKNMNYGFPSPYTLDDAKTLIRNALKSKENKVFAIEYKGSYVGNIGLFLGDGDNIKTAEIAYFIDQQFWSKGIATKAVKLITHYGFDKLELFRIHTGVFEFNTSSMKVLEKSGFTKEGIFKAAVYKNNQIINQHRYSIINPNLTHLK